MKKFLALALSFALTLPLAACGKKQGYDPLEGVETRVITDSAGRQVEIPADIQRVAPSGSTLFRSESWLHGPDDPHAHCL